ncbi:MAG: hypothetical protein K0Q72_3993, partial [Armatimonadetes bacterium]|nr:hypothetical protein [Armatimonadota bacterium]
MPNPPAHICPQCQQPNPPDALSCARCALPLQAQGGMPPPSAQPEPDGFAPFGQGGGPGQPPQGAQMPPGGPLITPQGVATPFGFLKPPSEPGSGAGWGPQSGAGPGPAAPDEMPP